MAGGYGHTPQGVEAIVAKFNALQKQQDDLRKMIVGLGIQIDGETGDLVFNGERGKLRITGTGGEVISGGGGLTVADGGTLTVIDADGHVVGLLGKFGDGTIGAGFWRSDGTAAFQVTPTFAAIYDKAGRPVVSDDYVHGSGLATPWVTGGAILADTNTLNWPQTVNGTFTEIALGYYRVENPRLQWTIEHVADTSTTGELKLLVNGSQVGATQTVTSAFAYWDTINVALPAGVAIGDLVPVSLQARRTAGTGTVYATALRFSGDQSP